MHFNWSPGTCSDDRIALSTDCFHSKEIIVSEKLDGENTNLYRDHFHARSLDSKHHPSRNWVKQLHGQIAHNIPEGFRLCGENLFATHSIHYEQLTSYFYLFSVWNEKNFCLSWDETKEWSQLLGIEHVPVLYEGIWDEDKVKACWTGISQFGGDQEGYVVRTKEGFHYDDFQSHVMKMVRKNHVQTSSHWMSDAIVPNKLITR